MRRFNPINSDLPSNFVTAKSTESNSTKNNDQSSAKTTKMDSLRSMGNSLLNKNILQDSEASKNQLQQQHSGKKKQEANSIKRTSNVEQAVEKILSDMLFGESNQNVNFRSSIDVVKGLDQDMQVSGNYSSNQENLQNVINDTNADKFKSAVKSTSGLIYEDPAQGMFSRLKEKTVRKLLKINEQTPYKVNFKDAQESKVGSFALNVQDTLSQAYGNLEDAVFGVFQGLLNDESTVSLETVSDTNSEVIIGNSSIADNGGPSRAKAGLPNDEISQEKQISQENMTVSDKSKTRSTFQDQSSLISNSREKRNSLNGNDVKKERFSLAPAPESSPHIKARKETTEEEGLTALTKSKNSQDYSLARSSSVVTQQSKDSRDDSEDFSEGGETDITISNTHLENMIIRILSGIMFSENPSVTEDQGKQSVPNLPPKKDSNVDLEKPLIGDQHGAFLKDYVSINKQLDQHTTLKSSDVVRHTSVDPAFSSSSTDRADPRNVADSFSTASPVPPHLASQTPGGNGYVQQENFLHHVVPQKVQARKMYAPKEKASSGTVHEGRSFHSKNTRGSLMRPEHSLKPYSVRQHTDYFLPNINSRKPKAEGKKWSEVSPKLSFTSNATSKRSVSSFAQRQSDESNYRGLVYGTPTLVSIPSKSETTVSMDRNSNQGHFNDQNLNRGFFVRVKVNCPSKPNQIAVADISPSISSVLDGSDVTSFHGDGNNFPLIQEYIPPAELSSIQEDESIILSQDIRKDSPDLSSSQEKSSVPTHQEITLKSHLTAFHENNNDPTKNYTSPDELIGLPQDDMTAQQQISNSSVNYVSKPIPDDDKKSFTSNTTVISNAASSEKGVSSEKETMVKKSDGSLNSLLEEEKEIAESSQEQKEENI